uniref:Uncharacterized protein n=1 Tax=Rhizophagus irregularis (strain DAOM 181602 / DAOM 197198 / MUCL 43194) TaxID=747089 RepID=U9URG2_RHIID
MWNPSDDENLKILSQSLKVKAFVNQLSKRSVLMKIEEDVGGGEKLNGVSPVIEGFYVQG